jgi:RNA polymerase sigma-70 factor (ECF subfamily)
MRIPVETLIQEYQRNLFVAAFNVCGNSEDAQDVVQDTFIQYHTSTKQFNDKQHIKAWLLRVAINKAKDKQRSFWHRKITTLEDYNETVVFDNDGEGELLEAVMSLPEKYRIVIHLFYYEDMSLHKISEILKISETNAKVRLSRGRSMLKSMLKEGFTND